MAMNKSPGLSVRESMEYPMATASWSHSPLEPTNSAIRHNGSFISFLRLRNSSVVTLPEPPAHHQKGMYLRALSALFHAPCRRSIPHRLGEPQSAPARWLSCDLARLHAACRSRASQVAHRR